MHNNTRFVTVLDTQALIYLFGFTDKTHRVELTIRKVIFSWYLFTRGRHSEELLVFDLSGRELTWKSKSGNVTHTAHTPQGFHIKMFLWFPPMENWQDWFKKGKEKCWSSVYPSIFAKLEPWQRMRSERNLEFKNSFSESTASTPGASSYRKTRKEALLRLDRDLSV